MKYLNIKALHEDFKKTMPWSLAISFYVFVIANDYLSSMLAKNIPGVHEANPYARDEALKFVLWKGVVVDLVLTFFMAIAIYVIYQTIAHWSKTLATVAGVGLIVYTAFDRLSSAVIENYLIDLHLYVKAPIEDMFKLFFIFK
jgi:hypothetical protein